MTDAVAFAIVLVGSVACLAFLLGHDRGYRRGFRAGRSVGFNQGARLEPRPFRRRRTPPFGNPHPVDTRDATFDPDDA